MEETEDIVQEMVVCDDGGWRVSEGTQTGLSDLVQITVPYVEMMRRIESFIMYKRHQVDVSNQLEFSHHEDPENTCARIDAVCLKRGPHHVGHIEAMKIHNDRGPNSNQLTPLEQLQKDLLPQPRKLHASPLLCLPERLVNLEKYLDLYSDTFVPRDMVERIRRIEMRLLELEGLSPEYPYHQAQLKSSQVKSTSKVHMPQGHPACLYNE